MAKYWYWFVLVSILSLTLFVNGYNEKQSLSCGPPLDFMEPGASKLLCSASYLKAEGHIYQTKVTHRLKTIRDLAWILTPRTYFVSNGNALVYQLIYNVFNNSTSQNACELERLGEMRTTLSYTLDDMVIAIKDGSDERGRRGLQFIRMVCSPKSKGVHGIWNLILTKLKKRSRRPLSLARVEETLLQIAERNPHFKYVVKEFAHFVCSPHPLCNYQRDDSPFCSGGSRPTLMENVEALIPWTDHISNSTLSGTAFMMAGCVNGNSPIFATLSQVPHQNIDNIEEFWATAKGLGFSENNFMRQTYYYIDK